MLTTARERRSNPKVWGKKSTRLCSKIGPGCFKNKFSKTKTKTYHGNDSALELLKKREEKNMSHYNLLM